MSTEIALRPRARYSISAMDGRFFYVACQFQRNTDKSAPMPGTPTMDGSH